MGVGHGCGGDGGGLGWVEHEGGGGRLVVVGATWMGMVVVVVGTWVVVVVVAMVLVVLVGTWAPNPDHQRPCPNLQMYFECWVGLLDCCPK